MAVTGTVHRSADRGRRPAPTVAGLCSVAPPSSTPFAPSLTPVYRRCEIVAVEDLVLVRREDRAAGDAVLEDRAVVGQVPAADVDRIRGAVVVQLDGIEQRLIGVREHLVDDDVGEPLGTSRRAAEGPAGLPVRRRSIGRRRRRGAKDHRVTLAVGRRNPGIEVREPQNVGVVGRRKSHHQCRRPCCRVCRLLAGQIDTGAVKAVNLVALRATTTYCPAASCMAGKVKLTPPDPHARRSSASYRFLELDEFQIGVTGRVVHHLRNRRC